MKFKRLFITLFFAGLPLLALPGHTSAVDVFGGDVCDRPQAQSSTVCRDSNIKDGDGNQQNPLIGTNGIITKVIQLLIAIAAIISIIIIILAGFKLVTSGTNSQDVQNARERIIYAIIALLVAVLAQAFVRFIISRLDG